MENDNKLGSSRRDFIKKTGAFSGMAMAGFPGSQQLFGASSQPAKPMKKITIKEVNANFEREPLAHLFGFKGGYLSEIWQAIAYMESENGTSTFGLGTQSVLWSDANVFNKQTESGGNALMFALNERALQMVNGQSFTSPIELLDDILPEVHEYGKKITGNQNLRQVFAQNALIAFDNAAWLMYAGENNIEDFDTMIPERYRQGLSNHHDKVAAAPSFSYNIKIEEIKEAARNGFFFMKIKLGQPGTPEEMLEKDKQRLTDIHKAIGDTQTKYTANGKLPYYVDINQRYPNKDLMKRLLDHADKIGALDQIVVLEDPFNDGSGITVDDLGVTVAADEGAHTPEGVQESIDLGYSAIALKPIAKTFSMTLKIIQKAYENNLPCYCADLTVNPILMDWNKMVAARLKPFAGLNMGLMETNGHQNYASWEKMKSYHPYHGASWTKIENGVFQLGDDFYKKNGGIFKLSNHYLDMVKYDT